MVAKNLLCNVIVVWSVRHMPNPSSPFYLQFDASTGITYLVDVNGDREEVYSTGCHTPYINSYRPYSEEELQDMLGLQCTPPDNTLSSTGTLPIEHERFVLADPANGTFEYGGSKQYDSCDICYDFSMLFGGSHKGRDIDNEEQFEIVKEEFVTHFNKCHKDIMEKRPEYKEKKFKKTKVGVGLLGHDIVLERGDIVHISTPSGGAAFYGTSILHAGDLVPNPTPYDGTYTVQSATYVNQPPPWQEGSRTPEYELEVSVNPANLDRNARFRVHLGE